MEGHLMLRSILNPLSNNVRSLDFIFNHHFTNRALFGKKFDPLTNDYLIGFWLAVFSTTMLDNRDRIADGLFGTLGDNNGFKTLMVLPEKASDGKTLLLIQNFYFNSDRRRIKNGGLSSKERAKIHFLLGETYEEKIVHYLVYDIGQLVCSNRSDKIRPFMELLLDIVPGDDNNARGDVEKFFKLEHFGNFFQNVEPTVQSLKLYGHNDENMQIITVT
uniref:Uncharacterized protein n=1 Tax=Romanomermis culicivorax TaxID=13658 RepID=A0A915I398_ROMCU